jgi:hypothetical protein
VGGALQVRVQRRPDVERLDRLVDQHVELRQRPIGEIAGDVLPLGIGGELHPVRIRGGAKRGRDGAGVQHHVEDDSGSAARRFGVRRGRIVGRRLDQAGDDRGLRGRELARRMAEEAPRGRIDAVGAAAEIDPVEVELEDLLLGEAPFERHRQDRLADLAAEAAAVVEEDVAGKLLRDRRSALSPPAARRADPEGAGEADRIDAGMVAVAPVLHRDHRLAHDRRDLVVAQPLSEARPHRHDHAAVGAPHPDHLAEIVAPRELLVGRQLADRHRHATISAIVATPSA